MVENMNTQDICIRLKAFDSFALDKSTKEILDAIKLTGTKVKGPIPLPTVTNKTTVLRSPHIDKKSREQFEIRIHKRVFYIISPDRKTVDSLMKLNLPSGIGVEIKIGCGKDE